MTQLKEGDAVQLLRYKDIFPNGKGRPAARIEQWFDARFIAYKGARSACIEIQDPCGLSRRIVNLRMIKRKECI